MAELVEFIPAYRWDEKMFISPDDVMVIKRHHKDRDMGEYSELLMRDGTKVYVTGLPTEVAQKIRDAKEVKE